MKKILITGANGLVGSYICRQLLNSTQHQIYALTRKSSNLNLLSPIKDRITIIEGDLKELEKIENQIAEMDLIIHTAGVVSYHKEDHPLLHQINHQATKELINLCLNHEVSDFLFLSSVSAINSGRPDLVTDEKSKFAEGPHNSTYGITKHLAEMEVWRGAQEGLNVAVLNPTIVIGAGIWKNSSLQMFQQVWDGMPLMTPGSNGFVDVRDVATACKLLIEQGLVGQQFVLNAENRSYDEIIKAISIGLHKKPPKRYLSKSMIPFIVGLEKLRSFILRKRPLLTSIALEKSLAKQKYNGKKVTQELGLNYRVIDQSIKESCEAFMKSKLAGKDHAILAL